jgi:hypothetical protein
MAIYSEWTYLNSSEGDGLGTASSSSSEAVSEVSCRHRWLNFLTPQAVSHNEMFASATLMAMPVSKPNAQANRSSYYRDGKKTGGLSALFFRGLELSGIGSEGRPGVDACSCC